MPSANGKVARLDLRTFDRGGDLRVMNLADINRDLVGFEGGFTDGHFGYFVPYGDGDDSKVCNEATHSGRVARVELQRFPDLSGVTILNLAEADERLAGFDGGFTDGRYGYFVPSCNNSGLSGVVARVDLQNFDPDNAKAAVVLIDLPAATGDPGLVHFDGGFTDGHYGYFVPSTNGKPKQLVPFGKVVRILLRPGNGNP